MIGVEGRGQVGVGRGGEGGADGLTVVVLVNSKAVEYGMGWDRGTGMRAIRA